MPVTSDWIPLLSISLVTLELKDKLIHLHNSSFPVFTFKQGRREPSPEVLVKMQKALGLLEQNNFSVPTYHVSCLSKANIGAVNLRGVVENAIFDSNFQLCNQVEKNPTFYSTS